MVDALLGPKWNCTVSWEDGQGQNWVQSLGYSYRFRTKSRDEAKRHFLAQFQKMAPVRRIKVEKKLLEALEAPDSESI